MIRIVEGDLLKADAEALVNAVNCVGVMGRGIALQFRKTFPQNFVEYKQACDRRGLAPGRVFVHTLRSAINPRYIINFPTKVHWKGSSKVEYVDSGLVDLVRVVRELNIQSVAVPPLGCGLGGLDWGDVKPRIARAFDVLPDVSVYLYEPGG